MRYESELIHYGVKGMKWGVRRYQNYDGTYTKAGVNRYKEALDIYNRSAKEYNKTKADYKAKKASKWQVQVKKNNAKASKKQMNQQYKALRKDKLGDKGKMLYRSNKRITAGNTQDYVGGLIASAGAYGLKNAFTKRQIISNGKLYLNRMSKNDKIAASAVGAGLAVIGAKRVQNYSRARKLRAYYGHTHKNNVDYTKRKS